MINAVSMVNVRATGLQNRGMVAAKPKAAAPSFGTQSSQKLASIPTSMILAQRPKVAFKGSEDDLSAYYNYSGPESPAIEREKYGLSIAAKNAAERGDYHQAAKYKLELADTCRTQGNERDAHLLETSADNYALKLAEKGEHKKAAVIKLDLADVLRKHGKESNAHLLETSAHEYAMKLVEKGKHSQGAEIIQRMMQTHQKLGNSQAVLDLGTTLTKIISKIIK